MPVIRHYKGLIKLHPCLGTCIVVAQALSCTGYIPVLFVPVFAPLDITSAKAVEDIYSHVSPLKRKIIS